MPVRRATDEPLQQDVQKHAREGRPEHTAAGGGGGDTGGVGEEAGPEQDGGQEFQVRRHSAFLTTGCSVRLVVIFCNIFLKCSTCCWAGTLASLQPHWWLELQRKDKTKHSDRSDATQLTYGVITTCIVRYRVSHLLGDLCWVDL